MIAYGQYSAGKFAVDRMHRAPFISVPFTLSEMTFYSQLWGMVAVVRVPALGYASFTAAETYYFKLPE